MRLIDADALAKVKFHGYPEIEITPSDVNAEAYKRGWNDAIDAVKHGRWIPSVDRWGDIITTVDGYTCSECGSFNADKDNYCPHCGARMDGEENG